MSVEIAWKQNILVTDFHLLKSLLVVLGFGSQAFVCGFSRQNINSVCSIEHLSIQVNPLLFWRKNTHWHASILWKVELICFQKVWTIEKNSWVVLGFCTIITQSQRIWAFFLCKIKAILFCFLNRRMHKVPMHSNSYKMSCEQPEQSCIPCTRAITTCGLYIFDSIFYAVYIIEGLVLRTI